MPVTSNIVVTFSEPIQRGSGSIILRDGIGNTLEWYDAASSSRLSINGNVLTIDPSTNLPPGISITLEITTGSLRDLTGNGVALSDSYGFSTVVNASDPRWSGTLGNDQFSVPAGALVADGLAGIDTLVFAQTRAAYTVQATLTGFNVVASNGSSNTQTTHVERLQFADPAPSANGHWALDFAGDGHAGTVAKILGAVFGPDSIHNAGYFGIGLKLMDDGMAYEPLMQLALDAAIGAGASNGAVVTLLYTNVVGVAPQPADLAYFVGLLDSHAFTPATLGILAADHSLNLGHIDLVGLAQTGIAYIPYAGG